MTSSTGCNNTNPTISSDGARIAWETTCAAYTSQGTTKKIVYSNFSTPWSAPVNFMSAGTPAASCTGASPTISRGDAGGVIGFISNCRWAGTTPVVPGVMPFVSVAGARRMSAMNNTHIPAWLQERMDDVADDPEATRRLGVEVAIGLVEGLLELDVPGVHLYAMNRAQSIQEIYAALGLHT